jgi:hypothetical protein
LSNSARHHTKYEWTSNILRDSYSSYVGHPPLLSYMAVGMGELESESLENAC